MFTDFKDKIKADYYEYCAEFSFVDFEKESENLNEEEKLLYMKAVTQMTFADVISVNLKDLVKHVKAIDGSLHYFDYCKGIPEEIILDYILPYRTNNEDFCLFAPSFFDELKDKVNGKRRSEAAKEVNFWCLSKATYAQADSRTRNAFAVYNCGKGRCGEESVFCVAALRSVGIPARQVYSPFWSHCDDNHAWVEVYTENGWEFMGACEPEDVLNTGWFNNASSRALAVRYRRFGLNHNEVTDDGNHIYTTGLSTSTYGKTHEVKAKVCINGKPCDNVSVGVYIINYGMPCRVLENKTNSKGEALFTLGRGDFMLIAVKENGYDIVSCKESDNEVNLELSRKPQNVLINQVPSIGDVHEDKAVKTEEYLNRIQKLNEKRITNHTFIGNDYKTFSGYNYPVIQKFLNNGKYSEEEKKLVLDTLTEKDFCDITYEALEDIAVNLKYLHQNNVKHGVIDKDETKPDGLSGCVPVYSEKLQSEDDINYSWNKNFVLPLRVKNETLYPHREFASKYLKEHNLTDPISIYNHLNSFKRYDEYNYGGVIPDLKAVLKYGCLTTESLPIHFVQLCRTIGIPAEIDPETNVVRYKTENSFMALGHEDIKPNKIDIFNKCGETFKAEEVTLSEISENGIVHFGRCLSNGDVITDNLHIGMNGFADGAYIVTASRREIDGSVYGYMKIINLSNGNGGTVNLEKIPNHTEEKLLSVDVPKNLGLLAGNNIVAFIENSSEPTEHFLNEILENREDLIKNRVHISLFTHKNTQNDILKKVLNEDFAEIKSAEFDESWNKFRADMQVGDFRLPFITAVKDGKGLYAFANYNVGTVGLINKIFEVKSK